MGVVRGTDQGDTATVNTATPQSKWVAISLNNGSAVSEKKKTNGSGAASRLIFTRVDKENLTR